jgi:hypothetical protein
VFRPTKSFDYWQGAMTFAAMMAEAQMVIAMRLMGMAGFWNLHPKETSRMVSEKMQAAEEAGRAASGALLSGRSAGAAAIAAVTPVRRRTRANVRRLGKRGPALGPRRRG